MNMTGEFKFDFATFRRMMCAASGRRKILLRVIGCLIFVIGIGNLVTALGEEAKVYDMLWSILVIIVGAVMAASVEVTAAIGWRRIRGLRERPWRYDMSESRIGIHTPQTDVSLDWDGVAKARTHPEFWLLRFSTRQTVAIPRAAFTAEDAANIDSLVARRQTTRKTHTDADPRSATE